MEIDLFESTAVFAHRQAEWDDLLSDSAANQIFLTCEWQSTWWNAYHPGRMWVLAVHNADGRWLGLAPWFITADDDATRVVRTIGCVDVTDYLDIVARHGFEEEVFRTLAGWLAAHTDDYDMAQLCNIPRESLALKMMPELVQEYGLQAEVRLQEVCPIVELPQRFEDYLAVLDKKNRHELRRKLRRATGQVEWYIVGPEHDLAVEMERFFALMATSSEEKAEFLSDPDNRTFFEAMAPIIAQRGWLQLAFLTVNGTAAAAYLNFDYNNHVLVYNSGLDPAVYGQFSPGIVLLARLIEHAIVQGREEFDFLRGDEGYKYDMGGHDTTVYQLVITHNREA